MLTAAPVDVPLRPVLAKALLAALRAGFPASLSGARCSVAAVFGGHLGLHRTGQRLGGLGAADRTAARADIDLFRVSGLCQNSGATSITTWYWFCAA